MLGRKVGLFLTRLFTNSNKDLFVTRLGVTLLINKFQITGPFAKLLDFLLRSVIGFLMEGGIFLIDLTLDSYREGQKLKEFEKAAREAYEKATKKVYDEKQKEDIRQEYLKIISDIGNMATPNDPGDGMHWDWENT